MKQTKKLIITLVIVLAGIANTTKAQSDFVTKTISYSFSNDSISGIDEQALNAEALSYGLFGQEYNFFMYLQKRKFINNKYNIKTIVPIPNNNKVNPIPAVYVKDNSYKGDKINKTTFLLPSSGACANEDFEDAQANPGAQVGGAVSGWSIFGSTGANYCSPPIPVAATSNYTIFNGPTVDPIMTAPNNTVSSYFDATSFTQPAGNCFIRLNDGLAGGKVIRMNKTYLITSSNSLFRYAYRVVVSNPNHSCCDQPGVQIKVTITNTTTGTSTLLACPQVSIAAGTSCGPAAGGFSAGNNLNFSPSAYSTNWVPSSIDLTSYIGYQVSLNVFAIDCALTGHAGYVYFDALCSPLSIIGNGTSFPAGTPSITLPTCGALGSTITLPSGLGPYTWSSPAPGSYQSPSNANQTLVTNLSAMFTVTMNPPGSCAPIIRTITTTITTAPSILANVVQPTCSSTVTTINISASSGASPYTFSCTSGVTSATSPTANVTTPAVGVNTVSLVDAVGCVANTTVNVQAAPIAPTFTLNPPPLYILDCTTPNIAMQVNVTSANTYSVLWSSVCQPTATGNNYNVTQPCTYSVTVTDVVSNCKAGSSFTVTQNASVPTVSTSVNSLNLTCAANTATMSGSSNTNTNVLFEWIDPSGTATTGSLVSVGAAGVYCFKVTNLLNGCSATKCVTVTVGVGFPTFITSSPSSYSLSCSTLTTQICVPGVTTSPTPGSTINYSIVPAVISGTPGVFNAISCSTVISVPGAYVVYVKDLGNNCVASQTVNIISYTTSPQVSSNISAPTTPTLTCSNPTILAIGTSSTNNTVISWIQPANLNISASTLAISNGTVATTGNVITSLGVFTVVATNTLTGCVTKSLVPVFNDKRIPTYSIVPGTNPPKVNCYGNPVILTGIATNTLYNTSTFTWTPPASGPAPLANSSYPAAVDGPYTVTGTFLPNGCTNTATFTVIPDYVIPVLTGLNTATLDCAINPTTAISAFASPISGYTYTWSAEFTATFTPNKNVSSPIISVPGVYNVAVTNTVNGCANTGTLLVVNGNLVVDFTADPSTGFAPATINFVNTSSSVNTNSIQSIWSFGNGTSANVNSTAGQSTIYTQPGTYTVTLIGKKGPCIDSAYKVIRIDIPSKLDVPNVFTPNGDGSNDVFFLKTTNLTEITAYIFDRWGNKVYEVTSNTGNIAWDGKNQEGKEAAVGTYFYIIKATGKDGQAYDKKGNVSLYR